MNTSLKAFLIRNRSVLAVFLLCFLFLGFFYGPVLFHPGDYLLNSGGDAIKNYYCFEWHVHNDTSLFRYTGTNYPFGEHHGYTDGNPLLSNTLRALPFFKSYSVYIFNLSLFLSFFFCALLLFKILKEFKVIDLFAIIASLGITFLCPQVFRLSGHFSLAYNFCIPLVIYLLVKVELDPRKKNYSYLLSLSILCFLFVHPYLGLISASFLFFYWSIKSLANLKTIRSSLLSLVVHSFLPLALYFLYTTLTDTHSDRVARPYGFFHYTASFETVFISTHKPFRHVLSMLYPIKGQGQEGLAYVGITSLFCLVCLSVIALKKRKHVQLYLRQNPGVKMYAYMSLSALILLFFSMGYPFKFHLEKLIDYLPALQQFRSLGRFAWLFYFVMTLAASIFISNYFLLHLHKNIRLILCSVLLMLFFIEAVPFHKEFKKRPLAKNYFKEENVNSELKAIITCIKDKQPQALIPLPFFHIGTDYYTIPGTEKIITASFIASYHSKTPLMAGITGRTSLSESEDLIQVLSSDLIEKQLKTKISSAKPFLILFSKEIINEEESAVLKKGKTVLETPNYILKEIMPAELFASSGPAKKFYFTKQRPYLVPGNGFLLGDSSYFYFCDFDSLPQKKYTGNAKGLNTLVQIPSNTFVKDAEYEISFWYSTRDRLDLDNLLCVNELNGKDTLLLSSKNIKSMMNLEKQKILATLSFKTRRPENKVAIVLKGISDRERVFYIDDLMIREKNNTVYKLYYSDSRKDSVLKINNIDLSP